MEFILDISARFTKRHFVRHKNTQKLEEAYIIQFLFLSLNMESVFKFIQRPQNGGHFSFSVFFAPHRPVNKQNVRGDENKNIAREVAWLMCEFCDNWKQTKNCPKFTWFYGTKIFQNGKIETRSDTLHRFFHGLHTFTQCEELNHYI